MFCITFHKDSEASNIDGSVLSAGVKVLGSAASLKEENSDEDIEMDAEDLKYYAKLKEVLI